MNRRSKIIVVLAVLVAGSMVASGVLVDYLSDNVEAEVEVESPMFAGISLGRESWEYGNTLCWRSDPGEYVPSFPEGEDEYGEPICDWDWNDWKEDTIILDNIHGGDTVTIYLMGANVGNSEITAHEQIIVNNPLTLTKDDFELITSRFDSIYGDNGYGGIHHDLETVWQINNCNIEMWSADDTSTWGVGEIDVSIWHITFKDNAFGTYTITYQILPL